MVFLIYILTIIKREEVKYSMDKYISNKIKNISLFMTFFVVILHSNNLEKSNVVNLNSVVQNFIGQGIVRVAVPNIRIFIFLQLRSKYRKMEV